MNDDPIVAAVRAVREDLARQWNFDVHAIFADMRSREVAHGSRLVRQPVAAAIKDPQPGGSARIVSEKHVMPAGN